MNTKQEKLAAARKKLKEFQGKQRENDVNRMKNTVSPADINRKLSSSSTSTDTAASYRMEQSGFDHRSPENCYLSNMSETHTYKAQEKSLYNPVTQIDPRNPLESAFPVYPLMPFNQSTPQNSDLHLDYVDRPSGTEFFNKEITSDGYSMNRNVTNTAPSNYANGIFTSETIPCNKVEQYSVPDSSEYNEVKPEICTLFKDSEGHSVPEMRKNLHTIPPQSLASPPVNDPKEFFTTNFSDISIPNEVHSSPAQPNWDPQLTQSITQLAEEKNNLMQVLKRTEELLKLKTDQEKQMAQNVSHLQSQVADLEGKFLAAQIEVQGLRVKNEQLMKQRDVDFQMKEDMQQKYNAREEQVLELQQKLDLQIKRCEELNLKLKEADTHLAGSLIKIQQLSLGNPNESNMELDELRNENAGLMGRIQDLEKSLEILNREKEQSSQSFHTYAQLYDSQINSLSTEVRNLVKENQQLLEKNEGLEKSIKELRKLKNESNSVPDQGQVADLTSKLCELTEENRILQRDLKEKMGEIEALQRENVEKSEEIIRINDTLQGIRSEFMKKQEDSDSHQKLLAAVESDKVAAARAVAQNYKLKEQVAELEEGFIKLSHEKLQLTDELSHEKYVRKELELRLQKLDSDHCHDHGNEHGHAHDHDHTHYNKSSDGTINESADIEELKNIIRQLEEDKTELLSRLNSSNSSKMSSFSVEHVERKMPESQNLDTRTEDPENMKLLLQQMEEKVKKTMNEIAALDEEKEKLEHLVLQLQGETETIGEYISLYQTQRMLLRQRNKEKDEQLMQLSKDKEELKSKLSTLNDLVNHLLSEKGTEYKEMTDISPLLTEDNKEVTKETAVKIQTLINEIQSTNLIDNQSVAFEHCPCCSGRLITI